MTFPKKVNNENNMTSFLTTCDWSYTKIANKILECMSEDEIYENTHLSTSPIDGSIHLDNKTKWIARIAKGLTTPSAFEKEAIAEIFEEKTGNDLGDKDKWRTLYFPDLDFTKEYASRILIQPIEQLLKEVDGKNSCRYSKVQVIKYFSSKNYFKSNNLKKLNVKKELDYLADCLIYEYKRHKILVPNDSITLSKYCIDTMNILISNDEFMTSVMLDLRSCLDPDGANIKTPALRLIYDFAMALI